MEWGGCLRKGLVRAACQSSCLLVVNSALSNVFRNRFDLMCATINGLRVFFIISGILGSAAAIIRLLEQCKIFGMQFASKTAL